MFSISMCHDYLPMLKVAYLRIIFGMVTFVKSHISGVAFRVEASTFEFNTTRSESPLFQFKCIQYKALGDRRSHPRIPAVQAGHNHLSSASPHAGSSWACDLLIGAQ